MDCAAKHLFNEAQGSLFVYTQSDEISLLLQDFIEQDTQAWFDGNLQKICSVSASIVTALFNLRRSYTTPSKIAYFDSRAFTIADPAEVTNYFLWRTRDCIRNSINSLGQCYFSQKELHGKNTSEVQDMLLTAKSVNWNDCESRFKTGSLQNKNGYIDIPSTGLYEFYRGLI